MPRNRSRSGRDLKRAKPKRVAHDRILIVCEGAKTEPNYLNEIRQALRIGSVDLHIVHSALGTEPQQIVESADKEFARTKAFEKIIVVFDRDQHLTYANALAMVAARNERDKNDEGKKAKFEAVVSVPSFEFWLLLHFEDIQGFLDRAVVLTRVKTHIAGYEKGNKDTFAKTKDRLAVASPRAASLKQRFSRLPGEDPYTDMHELVAALHALKA